MRITKFWYSTIIRKPLTMPSKFFVVLLADVEVQFDKFELLRSQT